MIGYTKFEDTQPDGEDVIEALRARVAELEEAITEMLGMALDDAIERGRAALAEKADAKAG